MNSQEEDALERKRKRLEAWKRKKQQQQPPVVAKVSLGEFEDDFLLGDKW